MRISLTLIILAASLSTLACGPKKQDKLGDNELVPASARASADPDMRCTAQVAQDEVRRQLFARAAEIRGSNGDNYARIAGFSVLQLDGAAPVAPVSAGELVDCRGHATLRLPPGLRVAGGRTAVGGDVAYSIAPGPRGAVTLGQSDAITIPLATLTQNSSAARAAPSVRTPTVTSDSASPSAPPPPPIREPATAPRPAPAPRPQVVRPAPPPSSFARPSFNCRRARTPSERAVCADPSLAALDRRMAERYVDAIGSADPGQNALLHSTRNRFLSYRERCGGNGGCIATTYRGRLREIDDIMSGQWHGGQ
jgi:hypothetical protein